MAKIGILTSTPSFNDNYGAVLQAYALQVKLTELGHEPWDLVYRDKSERVPEKKGTPLERFKAIFLSGNSFSSGIAVVKTKRSRALRERAFRSFLAERLSVAPGTLDYGWLVEHVSDYDAYICGSDQVWNPRCHGGVNDPGYFLQFACGVRRTVSYAPSFGVSVLPESCLQNLGDYASNIDFVSVREDSGAKLLSEAGIDAQVVVDPTLLLAAADYDLAATRPDWLPERYLAVYKFGERSEYDKRIRATARRLGLDVVNIPARLDSPFRTRWNLGPAEFLAIIRDAELVCTDSFHATVFSTVYRTPCIVFPRDTPGSKKSMNSRMEGLLRRLGMEARYASTPAGWDNALQAELDYDEAHRRLAEWRSDSEAFLQKALDGIDA